MTEKAAKAVQDGEMHVHVGIGPFPKTDATTTHRIHPDYDEARVAASTIFIHMTAGLFSDSFPRSWVLLSLDPIIVDRSCYSPVRILSFHRFLGEEVGIFVCVHINLDSSQPAHHVFYSMHFSGQVDSIFLWII